MRRLAALALLGLASAAEALPPHHKAGGGFQNVPVVRRAGASVAVPFFARMVLRRFGHDPGPPPPVVPNDGAFLRDNAAHSVATATWIGHATVLVQMDHGTFLTDPMWNEIASPVSFAGPRRFVAPGVALDRLPPIDFVVVSHSHYDHTDLPTLRALSNGRTRFLVPLGLGALLRDDGIAPVHELDWWDTIRIGALDVHCVPAQHWSQRGLTDRDDTLWSGWAVVGPTRRFFYAGDTGYFAGFREIGERLGPFGLAAVPIGAYEPAAMMRVFHMDPEEAVSAALDARAERVLGVHWGTFELTEEPLDEPPRRFQAAGRGRGHDPARVHTPAVGETHRW
jgi:N-acyl-phosphatidylethanolamine-hydrolysing phospholipase D